MSEVRSPERRQFEEHRTKVREGLARPGKPRERVTVMGVGYELVGEEERADAGWERETAEQKRGAWDETRGIRHREKQLQRSKLTPGERLDQALQEAAVLTGGMRSRSIAAMRGGSKPESSAPPQPGDSNEEIDAKLLLIAHHVEAIERDVDASHGLVLVSGEDKGFYGDEGAGHSGAYGDGRMMTTRERDRIVWEDFQGVHADDVAKEAPYLGTSGRTIERARKNEAERRHMRVKLSTGVVLGPEEPLAQAA